MSEVTARGAGSIEAVLSRARGGDHSPYEWLARSVSGSAGLVLDLACGAGAMIDRLARPGRTVIGLDRSPAELGEARARGRGPLVRGDAFYLPFADGSLDAVVSSLGLAVVANRPRLLAEVARVLRPGGVFAALTPSLRPVSVEELRLVGRLANQLRFPPHLPGVTEFNARQALAAAGLTKAEDKRARYHYEIRTEDDARILLAGLRGSVEAARAPGAVATLVSWANGDVLRVPMPMRRIIAIK